jgi:hypothetical protein
MRSNRTLALPLSASGSLVLQDSNYDVPVFSLPLSRLVRAYSSAFAHSGCASILVRDVSLLLIELVTLLARSSLNC